MSCEHRYRAEYQDGKGAIVCQRCGDIRIDGIPLEAPPIEAIEERIRWERKKRESPIWTPPGI